MVHRIFATADAAAAHHLEEATVASMAFDLNDATVDIDVIEVCASELLQRRHPIGAVSRLIGRAIEVARQQRSAWP